MGYPITVKIVIWLLQILVEITYLPIHFIRLFKVPKKCPPLTNEILLWSASTLAKRIRKKEITSVAVIEAYISRINEVNPIINAVIENRFQAALNDAKKADELLKTSGLNEEQIKKKYPLLGVPITIKGSIAVTGMVHSAGNVVRTAKAEVDATCVGYARNAGAIPLLTSNVPELCLNWETSNKLIGTTSNPYDTTRTVGGSSGGEASLLGCGASIIGIGSDIGGSLRLPAHYCGVWGHKPTPLAVSCLGHYPDCKDKDDWNKLLTLGPMARYAGDLRLLLSVIVEPDMKNTLKLNERIDIKNIKVYYMVDNNSILATRTNSAIIKAVEKVVSHFDLVCNSKCEKLTIPLMEYSAELAYIRLLGINNVENIFDDKGSGSYSELLRFLGCRSKHSFNSIVYGLARRNRDLIPVKLMNRVYKYIGKLRNQFIDILGNDGICILPTSPHVADYHGDVYRKLFDSGYLSIFNSLGFPATNCPITFSENGMPIGIQVIAAPNLDRLTLSVAEELERVFGGWKFH